MFIFPPSFEIFTLGFCVSHFHGSCGIEETIYDTVSVDMTVSIDMMN